MSEAESRSGPDYDEVNTKKVVLNISPELLEWTSSRTRPLQLSQSQPQPQPQSQDQQQCLSTSSSPTNKSDTLISEVSLTNKPTISEPIKSPPAPSPTQEYAIQTPKCTENNASASPKSSPTRISSDSNNTRIPTTTPTTTPEPILTSVTDSKNESSQPISEPEQESITEAEQEEKPEIQITVSKSDSEVEGESRKSSNQTSHHKKSQEVTNSSHSKNIRLPDIKNPKSHHRSRKEAGIPVGIAVAWQRLVTSASTSLSTTNTTSTASASTMSTASDPSPISAGTNPKSSSAVPNKLKVPQRPSSASPILPKSSKDDKRICRSTNSEHPSSKLSGAELSVPSRPLPSSSVPPSNSVNLLSNHLGNYLDHQFPYGDSIGYSSPNHLHSNHPHYAEWQSNLMLPHFSQGYNAAAAYLQQQQQQQLSLQQLHLSSHGYSYPVSSYMYAGYPPESLHQFEQFLHQQQQSDLLRHHHQQQQQQHHQQQHQHLLRQQAEYEMQRRTPIPSPSPRLSIPVASPSPTTPSLLNSPSSLSVSQHGARATTPLPTNWSDLYHHNSSTALSPKSLTSSTPSPVTVHDFNLGFNITLSRKCATPNSLSPANITTINSNQNSICGSKGFPFSSPFSPSLFPSKDVWKDVKKISPVPLKRKKSPPSGRGGSDNDNGVTSPDTCEKQKDNNGKHENFNGTDNNRSVDSSKNSNVRRVSKFSRNSNRNQSGSDSGALVVVKVEPKESDVDIDVEEGEEEQEQIKIPQPLLSVQEEEEGLDTITRSTSPCANSKGGEPLLKISKKHDFKRLESLIEKRADESVPLLTHSHSSEDSETEVHERSRKKAKLELPKESDKGNGVLPTTTSSSSISSNKSISTSAANTKAAILLETEMERFSPPGKTTFTTDLASNLPVNVNVKIKREKVEHSQKYNDTCQNFETVPQTFCRAIKQEENRNMCSSSVNITNPNPEPGEETRIQDSQTSKLINPTLENGILDKDHQKQDQLEGKTNCKELGKVSSVESQLSPRKLVESRSLVAEESEFSKKSSLKICNELKTHDDCDFDCVDDEKGVDKGDKVVPESNLPFSNSFKKNNKSSNRLGLREEPINPSSISNSSNSSDSKLLEPFVTKRNESSKNVNVLVGEGGKRKKNPKQSYPENYFDSFKSKIQENQNNSSKTTNICGIAVKIDDKSTNSCSKSVKTPTISEDDGSPSTEIIIRIRDDKNYVKDEDIDSTNGESNQYKILNGKDDICTYSNPNSSQTLNQNGNQNQNQSFANNIRINDSIRDNCTSTNTSGSSSILMTSSEDKNDGDCSPISSEQMTYANQYSFNKSEDEAQNQNIYHNNRIINRAEDYSLSHNLIRVKRSESENVSSPDAPHSQVDAHSHPPVTLCYLSQHPVPVQIISPQNIKIPSYVPTSGGYTMENEDGEKKYTTTVLYHAPETFSLYSYGSPLASPPPTPLCDKEISTSGDDNILQLRQQRILPIENQQTMQIRRNSFYISPETCIKPEDNHLDLLATVAQEFGRSDLVKVSNCLSFGGGTSCLSPPTSLQTIVNVNTSSTSNSIYTTGENVLQLQSVPAPASNSQTTVYQEPIQAQNANTNISSSRKPKSVADMFEFRSEDEDAFLKIQPLESKGYIRKTQTQNPSNTNNLPTNTSTTTYQPVLLKIPHIVPKAAASAAEKLKKAKLRQEKAKEKNIEKKKRKKDLLNIPSDDPRLSPKLKLKTKKKIANAERKPSTIDIPFNNQLDEKIKIPKVKTQIRSEEMKAQKMLKKQQESQNQQFLPVKITKKETSENPAGESEQGKGEKKRKKKAVLALPLLKETENPGEVVTKPKIKKIKKPGDALISMVSMPKVVEGEKDAEKVFSGKQKRPSGSFSSGSETSKDKERIRIKSENKVVIKAANEENASVKKSLNNSDLNYCTPTSERDKDKGKTSNKRNKTAVTVNRTSNGNKTGTTFAGSETSEKDSPPKKKRKPNNKLKAGDLALGLGELGSLSGAHQQTHNNHSHTQSGKVKPGKCIPMLSPSNVENEIANVHINVNLDRDRENEFDWETNPAYAVTAIKMTNGTNKICCESTDSPECTDKSEKKEKRKSSKPSKLTLLNSHNQPQPPPPTAELSESEKILKVKSQQQQLKSFVHFAPRRIQNNGHSHAHGHGSTLPNRRHSSSSTTSRHIKPCLKAEPTLRPMSDKEDSDDADIDFEVATLTRSISSSALSSPTTTNNSNTFTSSQSQAQTINNINKKKAQQQKDKDRDRTMTNVFSRKIESEEPENIPGGGIGPGSKDSSKLSSSPSANADKAAKVEKRGRRTSSSASLSSSTSPPKSTVNEKVEIENVTEMLDEMRILTEIQGLFYTGKLNALQPPDVYGVTLDNERGAPPHIIFSAEEVLEKCIREVKPCQLNTGLRICAYWSPQYSGLYPGKVSLDYSPSAESDLIPIEFDDGDTGVIKVGEIRLLATNHPIREYDPNPLLTLEKKHRKRRHSSTNGTSGACTGDHEDADCGEPYCAKLAKLEEEEKEEQELEHRSSKLLYWTWTGLGYKIPKTKKYRHKEFFRGIQRGDEVINVGDSALFISNGNDRPFIGRVERFWEKKGRKIVNVKWFYHPEEVETGKRLHGMKYAGALFESPHIDENDVQTIAKKCEVLPFKEFKERVGGLPKLSKNASPKDIYYIAGFYNPYTFKLKINDLK